MSSRRRGGKLALRAGALALLLAALLAALSRDEIRAWYLLRTHFEKLGENEQGYPEYRHRKTGGVFVLLPGVTCEVGCTEEEWDGYLRRLVADDHVSMTEDDLSDGLRSLLRYHPREFFPRQTVTLDPFLIGKRELTVREWLAVVGDATRRGSETGDAPCGLRFSEIVRFDEGTELTLPNEAQWEYAALGGIARRDWKPSTVRRIEWDLGRVPGDLKPPGTIPNGFGLHRIFGGLNECCMPGTTRKLASTFAARGGRGNGHSAHCGIESRFVTVWTGSDDWFSSSGLRPVFNLYDG